METYVLFLAGLLIGGVLGFCQGRSERLVISLSTPTGDELSAAEVEEVRDSIKTTIDGQLRSSRTNARELLIEAIGAERYERLIADLASNVTQTLL